MGRSLFRLLMVVLPREFRRRHGAEMEELLAEALERAGRSRAARLRVRLAAAWDVVRRAPVEHIRGRSRKASRPRMVGMTGQDLRHAVRSALRQPGVTSLVVGMLALGIAANTAVFTIVNGLYLRPMPFPEPDRLVYLNETAPRWDLTYTGINYPDFHRWREDARVFEGLALYDPGEVNLSDDAGTAERMRSAAVTHDFFEVLGVRPVLGRVFSVEEDRPGGESVVLLSEDLWRRRFGEAADIVGRVLRINSRPHTVVGVLPAEAEFPDEAELWVPAGGDPQQPYESYEWSGIGRLKSGVTPGAARADLLRAHEPIYAARDEDRVVSPVVVPLRERFVGELRTASRALLGGVAIVLLVACANVASLMLARALARRREMGIRRALGAGTVRLVRQLMTENLVLAVLAGAIGLVAGYWVSRLLVAMVPDQFPDWVTFELDARVAGFSLLLALIAALLFGLAPLAHAFGGGLRDSLQGSSARATASVAGRRTLAALVAGEIALSAMLLVGGGLLVRAYERLRAVDPGFSTENVLTFGVSLPGSTYPDGSARVAFWEELTERLAALPGVQISGAVSCPPLGCHQGFFVVAEGAPAKRPEDPDPVILTRAATPGYLEAMGVRLVRGRFLEPRDGRDDGSLAVVVNETFARLFWPGEDPVGKRIRARGDVAPGEERWWTVVGMTADVRHYGLDEPMRPGIYLPVPQRPLPFMTMVLRTRTEPAALVPAVRQAVRELNADLPIYGVATMEEALRRSTTRREAYAWMLSVFAAAALLLAVGGIYGVASYAVTRRTRELGIRVALGARARDVTRSVLRGGMSLVVAGLVVGMLGALAGARALSSLLFGVEPGDPSVYAIVAGVLLLTAFAANLLPARRAARVDPMSSLRSD